MKTAAILAIGIIAISFAAIFVRFCTDVPSLMIAAYRLSLASAVMIVFSRQRTLSFRSIGRKDLVLCIAAGFFLSLHFMSWIASLKFTSVASSVVLVTTNPLFVGILSSIFFKERCHAEVSAGIVLCIAGSLCIAIGDGGMEGLRISDTKVLMGDGLALFGAVMASCYLLVGSRVRERMPTAVYMTIVTTVSALILLFLAIALRTPFTGYKAESYIFLILLAAVPQLIGHTSINWALRHLRASMVAISILGEAIGATSLAYLFFGETVGILQVAGMALIFTAIVIASRRGGKEREGLW
ncbi:MAG: DMT family transporter [Deltaproteobacteria bacterium]|nr:DMT family transporter [Deltaproteobacteria bacterium]